MAHFDDEEVSSMVLVSASLIFRTFRLAPAGAKEEMGYTASPTTEDSPSLSPVYKKARMAEGSQ